MQETKWQTAKKKKIKEAELRSTTKRYKLKKQWENEETQKRQREEVERATRHMRMYLPK